MIATLGKGWVGIIVITVVGRFDLWSTLWKCNLRPVSPTTLPEEQDQGNDGKTKNKSHRTSKKPKAARVGEMQIDDQEAESGGESPAGTVGNTWSPALMYSKNCQIAVRNSWWLSGSSINQC